MAQTTPVQEQSSQLSLVRHYFLYILVGGLVASALIAVGAILAGSFNDVASKALLTVLVIVIHSFIGLAFLSVGKSRSPSSTLIVNTLFVIVVASLVTSIFGIWKIISGHVTGDFYGTYFLGFIAVLIIAALLTAHTEDKVVNGLVATSTGFVTATFIALLPWVFADSTYVLPDFYFRLVAALFVLAATVIVLTVIFNWLFIVKHPATQAVRKPGSMPPWLLALVIALAVVFGGGFFIPFILAAVFGSIFSL